MIINLLLFILILIISYIVVEEILKLNMPKKINKYLSEKNEKYYEELLKFYEKNKKIKLKNKLNILDKINIKLDKAGVRRSLVINPITLLLYSIICFIFFYIIIFSFLKIILLSLIISIPSFFIPMVVVNFIGDYKNEKIERIFLNFLMQLKNFTKINNDIVYAFGEVQTIQPLQGYINTFLIELNSGIRFEKAIENFKEKINVEVFKNFISNLEHCYLYGGSFTLLIDNSYKMISEIQKEKNARMQETKSAILVMYILIFLNLFVYITNINNNYENYVIMQKTFFGNLILYWNFISIWLLLLLANNVKKLDY